MPTLNRRKAKAKIEQLLQLLVDLSTRPPGEKGHKLSSNTPDLRAAIVLVGEHRKVRRGSCLPYIRYILREMQEGIDTFYILARGELNTAVAKNTADLLAARDDLTESYRYERTEEAQDGTQTPGIILCLEAKQRKQQELVRG